MRHKNLFVPMGINPHRYKPHIWGIAAGIAGSLLSNFVSNEMNKDTTNSINDKMIGNQWEMFRAQNERQDYLNENQDLIKRNSLKKAGMNIYSEFGGYPNMATNAVSQPQLGIPTQSIDGATLANLIQQAPLIGAEVEKKKAEKNLLEKQSGVAEADELLKRAQAWRIDQLTPEEKKNLEENNKKIIAETEKINVDKDLVQKTIDKTMEETDAIRIQNNLLMAETPLILQKMATEIAVLHSQGQLYDAQTIVAYKSLALMSAQIQELVSRAHLNEEQAKYVANLATKAWIDSTFSPFEHLAGIGLTNAQIDEVKQSFENLKQHNAWVPFNNIVGAYTGVVGSASGAIRAGLGMGSAGQ